MKKNLLLALMLMLLNVTFAQTRSYIVNESFDGVSMPEGWYFTGEGETNFSIKTSNKAGGSPNELHLRNNKPIITSGIHLVMATADLTNVESLGLSFKHYIENYQLSNTIGIATSSDNGTTWNTAWSQTYSEQSSTGQYNISEVISTPDMGKENVLICLFQEGNTSNFKNWYFDDFLIYTHNNVEGADLQLTSIDMENVVPAGSTKIKFTATNTGKEDITSFTLNCEIEGYDIVTETFETEIASHQSVQLTFKTAINLAPGTHDIKVSVAGVNEKDDAYSDNNTASKIVKSYIKTVERTPLIEQFSSATCDNCVTADNTLLTLTHDNEGRFAYVYYPFNYPLPGDKYYTEECGARSDYYGVSGVPLIIFDGGTQTKEPKQSHFDDRYGIPSYIDIAGAFNIEDKTINMTADIISYIDMSDVKVFATVNEKMTTGNVGTNGLTEFHHVFMSMVTGTEGIDTSFKAGQYQRYEFSCDMSETNVEDMSDLEVTVWVQKYDSKEVFNSSFLYEYTEHPYPVQNLKVEGKTLSWDAPEKGTPVGYNVYVNNKLAAENISESSHKIKSSKDEVLVEVVALYENGKKSVGVTMSAKLEDNESVAEETESSIQLYPNPASNDIHISSNERIEEVRIYNINGQQTIAISQQLSANSCTINIANLNSGIYIVKINTEKGNIVKRFIKY